MKVLFICTGNICRSPTAEALLRSLRPDWQVDSCGTHNYHVGEKPDMRAIHTASKHNITMNGLKARQIKRDDFEKFDYIFAMDQGHLRILNQIKPEKTKAVISLYLDHNAQKLKDVPDPYYGDQKDFDGMYKILEEGVEGLIHYVEVNADAN